MQLLFIFGPRASNYNGLPKEKLSSLKNQNYVLNFLFYVYEFLKILERTILFLFQVSIFLPNTLLLGLSWGAGRNFRHHPPPSTPLVNILFEISELRWRHL